MMNYNKDNGRVPGDKSYQPSLFLYKDGFQ